MPRAGRLTSAADFRRTYASGRRVATLGVVAHVLATGENRPSRVGVSASRTVGGSVRRNRAKRRLREAIRPLRDAMDTGVDVVLVATPATTTVVFQELVDNVRAAVETAGASHA